MDELDQEITRLVVRSVALLAAAMLKSRPGDPMGSGVVLQTAETYEEWITRPPDA